MLKPEAPIGDANVRLGLIALAVIEQLKRGDIDQNEAHSRFWAAVNQIVPVIPEQSVALSPGESA